MKRILLFTIAVMSVMKTACSQDYFPLSEKEGGWRKNTSKEFIQSTGFDPDKLEEFGQWNIRNNWNGNSLMFKSCIVIKNGWIIGEWYSDNQGNLITQEQGMHKKARLASNGKSISIALFGVMMKENDSLPTDLSLDSKVYDRRWLPEAYPLSDPRKEEITFEHIFQHTSGILPELEHYGKDRGKGRNNIAFILGKHKEFREAAQLYFSPGKIETYLPKSAYSSVSFRHLAVIFRNLCSVPAHTYLEEKLLNPIGIYDIKYYDLPEWTMENIKWITSGGIWLKPRDYARFAYFLLKQGRWNSKHLLPEGYIQHFMSTGNYPNMMGNVEGIWTKSNVRGSRRIYDQYPEEMLRLSGSGLNKAYIFPGLDLVVIRTSRIYEVDWYEIEPVFMKKLFACILDYEPPAKNNKSKKEPLPGQIIVDPENPAFLVYNKDENQDGEPDPFFMCGPGDPEGFLYRGSQNPDGTRNGDQFNLIQKLKQNGGNCIYLMAVRTHGGDAPNNNKDDPHTYPDDKHNPWIDNDPAKGLNQNILDQWESWFTEMDKNRIVIYFFFYDDAINISENLGWPLNEYGNLHPGEKKFIQSIANKFEHHKHLIWCIMEEAQECGEQWELHISKIAQAIREADNYNHVIASHQLSGNTFYHAHDQNIDQFAVQTESDSVTSAHDLYNWMIETRNKSSGKYSINMAEDANHRQICCSDKDRPEMRKRNWATAMTGAHIMIIGMNISDTPENFLKDCRILQNFFESTDFNRMSPQDELKYGETQYVLANPGQSYIAYGSGSKTGLGLKNLLPGTYHLKWLECSSGETVVLENVEVKRGNTFWEKPFKSGEEVALYVKRVEF